MHKALERFYINILDYAGLEYEDKVIKNKDEKLGNFTVNDKFITLPYHRNLKNPNNRLIFHLLNENYVNPETTLFKLYKKRLVAELNFKLLNLFSAIIEISSDINLVKKIKDSYLLEILSNFHDVDLSSLEELLKLCKKSKDVNDESFLIGIYLKKNGVYKDNNYDAVGKINFILYKEINKALESKEYKVYNYKLRKKDLELFNSIFLSVFPNIDDENYFTEATNNKVFRYLDVLLKTSFLVASYINKVSEKILEIDGYKDKKEDLLFNLDWVEYLKEVYNLKTEIRLIPNQDDISIENRIEVNTDSSVFKNDVQNNVTSNTTNINNNTNVVNTPNMQISNQYKQVTPEDILKNNVPFLPQYSPNWLREEIMKENINNPNKMLQQPMIPMQGMMPMQQPMQQPMLPMQGMVPMQQPMMPMQGMMPMQQPMQQPMLPMQGMVPMQQPMMPMQGMMPMQQPMLPMQGMVPMQQPMMPMQGMIQQNTTSNVTPLQINPLFFSR